MNKLKKILLAIIAGADVAITVITPIFISLFWYFLFGVSLSFWVLFIGCGLASIFRGIKIGWMRR